MDFLEALKQEHTTIEAVASAFVAFADARARAGSTADPADVDRFLRFFRLYAGRYHHGREEDVLFRALIDHTDVPPHSGPITSLLADHRELESRLRDLASLEGETLLRAVTAYASALLHHIDAETSVLFPESEARFRRVSLLALDSPPPDDEERTAREDGLRLVERYGVAALVDPSRGEGCVCCPSFGVRCDGVEREWSSDEEWDDMHDRVGR